MATKRELIKEEVLKLGKEGVELVSKLQTGSESVAMGYQEWYTKAIVVVRQLAPDRLTEFVGYYLPDAKRKQINARTYTLQDFFSKLRLVGAGATSDDAALILLTNQLAVFTSLLSRIDSVLANVEAELFAGLKDDEIHVAREVMKVSLRAAGAIVGVVMESHLQKVAAAHNVTISKKHPTLADLNDPLKAASVIDTPTWRKISYLADIRNLCCHKKGDEPTKEQVGELIDGADWLVKNVN